MSSLPADDLAEYVERVERILGALSREDRSCVLGAMLPEHARELWDAEDNAWFYRNEAAHYHEVADTHMRRARLFLGWAIVVLLIAAITLGATGAAT